jgi:hypothetical protein
MILVGSIALGVATMRAGVLPRWAGLLLIVSGVAGLLVIAPLPALVRNILAAISSLAFFLGLAWIGYALWSEPQQRVEEAQVPVAQPPTVDEPDSNIVTGETVT